MQPELEEAEDNVGVQAGEDSDDDFDWEEVDVPQYEPPLDLSLEDDAEGGPSAPSRPNIEITIRTRAKEESLAAK